MSEVTLDSTPYPQCLFCAHLRAARACEAFPGGIPAPIWGNLVDHRKEFAGDDGIRFEPTVERMVGERTADTPPAGKTAEIKTSANVPTDTPASIPTSDTILAEALEALGLTNAYAVDDLDGEQALEVLHEIRLLARAWLRIEGQKLLDVLAPGETKGFGDAAKAAIGGFFKRANRFIREVFVAGALALGGPTPLDADDLATLDANHAEQVEYLAGFRGALLDGSQALDGTLVSRAEQYGASAWASAQDLIRKRVMRGGIFDEEKRTHVGSDMPCSVCATEQAKGWVPVGTLKAIGQDSPCLTSCHCHFSWRNSADPDTEYTVPHRRRRPRIRRTA